MRIRNNTGKRLVLNDLLINGYPLTLLSGESKTVFDEDAQKSAGLIALINAGTVAIVTPLIEPNTLPQGLEATVNDLISRVEALEGAS